MIALIDGDIIACRAGFAAQKVIKSPDDFNGDCLQVEPLKNALYNVKSLMNKICNQDRFDAYQLFIGDEQKTNYRYNLAKLHPYKSSRREKPYWNMQIREYMIRKFSAEVVVGQETDDALGIEQMKYFYTSELDDVEVCESCICTIDKDLNMIPGMHYNFVKDLFYFVTYEQANRAFYTQLLMGDRVDTIPGLPGIGIARATKLLSDCPTELHMKQRCQELYEAEYKERAEEEYLEAGRMLWIRRQPDEIWELW